MNPEHLKALQKGRERAAAKRHKAAIARVVAFCDFTKKDADLWGKLRRGDITSEEYQEQRPDLVPLPSDDDFRVARAAGAKRFDGSLI